MDFADAEVVFLRESLEDFGEFEEYVDAYAVVGREYGWNLAFDGVADDAVLFFREARCAQNDSFSQISDGWKILHFCSGRSESNVNVSVLRLLRRACRVQRCMCRVGYAELLEAFADGWVAFGFDGADYLVTFGGGFLDDGDAHFARCACYAELKHSTSPSKYVRC